MGREREERSSKEQHIQMMHLGTLYNKGMGEGDKSHPSLQSVLHNLFVKGAELTGGGREGGRER